jgi:agmatinase
MDHSNRIAPFDPDGVGSTEGKIFGLPFTPENAKVVILPIPWDVTVSSQDGTSSGPLNILQQSPQIDLYDERVHEPWKVGIAMENIQDELVQQNVSLREKAKQYIAHLEEGTIPLTDILQKQYVEEINKESEILCERIRRNALDYLKDEKLVVLIGGDHSTPLGLLKAMNDIHDHFGILHIDAHADLRNAFMGFTHSHASIMHNALQLQSVSAIVQVGLRDISQGEVDLINNRQDKLHAYFARDLYNRSFRGENWKSVCDEIVAKLPQKVYISFDIDGLDPSQCLSTGTPVPGGLSYSQVLFLFEQVVDSGRTIIGFDLVETGPDPLDGITSCRILYKTIALMIKSNSLV